MGFVPPPSVFEGKEKFEEWLKARLRFNKFAFISLIATCIGLIIYTIIACYLIV